MKHDRWGNLLPEPHERLRYLDLCVQQILAWHNGRRFHHPMTNECCPDFSCCHPELYEQDENKRLQKLQSAIECRDAYRAEEGTK